LKRMLIALGRRSLMEQRIDPSQSGLESHFESDTERLAYAEPREDRTVAMAAPPAPVRVNAQPELLPPRPGSDPEKEREPLRATAPVPLRDGRETQDEIQTLPSWRGQYRKKRYPSV
jgi:hypothetical protein